MLTNSTSLLEICQKFFRSSVELFKHTRIMNWIKSYFCVGWGAAVITGFTCTHWFVSFGALDILFSYFEESWEEDPYPLPRAVGMVSLLEGLSAMFGILTPFICKNQDRRLKVIICSTVAYIVGMGMLCFSALHPISRERTMMYFVPAVVLISVGKSGGVRVLGQLLAVHLLVAEDILPYQSTSEGRVKATEKVNARMKLWWTTSQFVCQILAVGTLGNSTWKYTFISSTSAMLIGFLLFLCWTPLNHRLVDEDEDSTSEIICDTRREFDRMTTQSYHLPLDEASTTKISHDECIENASSMDEATTAKMFHDSPIENDRSVDKANTTEISFVSCAENDRSIVEDTDIEISCATRVEIGRSMDESTVMEISLANRKENDRSGTEDTTTKISHASPAKNDRSVDEATTTYISLASPRDTITNDLVFWARSQAAQWMPLCIMIPIWTTFLVSGVLSGIGSTFFLQQALTMSGIVAPMYYLSLVRDVIVFGSFEIYDLFLSKCLPKPFKTQGIKVGIWAAMVLSVSCCSVAWRVEVRRLHNVAENELCDGNCDIPMSYMWLVPQFCLLGLMEGIGLRSLLSFVVAQFSDEPVIRNGWTLSGAVIGFGSSVNGLLVHLLRSWFCDTLNCNHFDKYYQMMTVLTFVNLCYYWVVSTFYFTNKEPKEDVNIVEIILLPMAF